MSICNFTHSPGPWKLEEDETRLSIVDADGEFVEFVRRSRYHDDREDPVAECNLRLMVHAPELLMALEDMVRLARNATFPRGLSGKRTAMARLKAADLLIEKLAGRA